VKTQNGIAVKRFNLLYEIVFDSIGQL